MFRNWPPLNNRLSVIGLGAVAACGQAPLDLPVLTVVALALFMAAVPARRMFWRGWWFGLGYFTVTMNWIVEPFLVELAKTGLLAPPALILMAGGLALFWGAACRMAQGWGPWGIALTLALAEYARSHVFGGLPWAVLGYVWVDTPLYQISRIIGPHGVTLFTLVMAAIITRIPKPAQIVMLMAVAIAPFLPTPQGPKPAAGAPIARLIHPNVVQQDKLNPDLRETLYQKQLALAALGPAVDLIILPETAIYLPMHIAAPEIADIAQGAHVFAGAQRRDGAGYYYNAGHMLTPDATVSHIYDKARLVPFGEYIPLGDWLETWGIYGLAARDVGFSKGPGPQVLTVPAIGKIHPLICYEGIFPHFVAATDNRPDMIVLITNDGWFGSVNGPAQHFAQARARAIELGLPILRVANRGVTGVIDARGFVPVSTQDYTATALDVAIPPAAPATLYSTWRDIPFIAILCILCLMGVGRRRLFH